MDISNAQYIVDKEGNNESIKATIDGFETYVPLDTGNRHYQAILKWAEEDGNEIQAAE